MGPLSEQSTSIPGNSVPPEQMHQAAPMVEVPRSGLPEKPAITDDDLRSKADLLSRSWKVEARAAGEDGFALRLTLLRTRLRARLVTARSLVSNKDLTPQLELLESTRMFEATPAEAATASQSFTKLPRTRHPDGSASLRVLDLAYAYIAATSGIWSADSLRVYVKQAQLLDPLLLDEIRVLPTALKLAQLTFLLDIADTAFAHPPLPPIEQSPFSAPIHSLRRMNQFEWGALLESLVDFDPILRQDTSGVFPQMEEDSRANYHNRVAMLASHSDMSERETCRIALQLAQQASNQHHPDPRVKHRVSHIGYYLFAEGLPELRESIGYHAPKMVRVRDALRRWNKEFYILGIFGLSMLLITGLIAPLVPHHEFWPAMFALLLALVPATQGAVDLVNSTVSSILHAESLPKIDLSKGIPHEAKTLVVVPTLLLNESQVRDLLEELEARYLANQDPNVHFGLLTDLPDSRSKPTDEDSNPLTLLAVQAIHALNEKYKGQSGGLFFLLHRHRVFNVRQGVWMGWERKRGKLLDLNKLLLHQLDAFPVKAGAYEILQDVRYVITLDSDTQLPRGVAARMIGTMAHPLNQAIIDPRRRVVTAGYGILQPRVGVSVSSASRSRLARLYSGETGFDIYSRAVSDVYQDLFGEGIFTGKGIYEVSVFHQVLDRRFPRNALLSHDLIEGAYARAGLVTDIEIIDDYPSHYSAHARRKHRWVRGDWQIARWLFDKVPNESGRQVNNPINTISRWKILDNLRRSMLEPITFLLLIAGWFFLVGGPRYWTIATLLLLVLPNLVQLGFNLARALFKLSLPKLHDAFETFWASLGITLLNLTFLPHHMFMSMDAIVRSLSRSFFSGKHMLEWETAAQAESGKSKTPLDWYLRLSPVLSLCVAGALAAMRPHSLIPATPVLILWALAPAVSHWLNAPPIRQQTEVSPADRIFLKQQALLIWRYFAEFGDEKNRWLIPDNVEEKDLLQVRKLSPTNLGMLLNSRQAAYEFGFITLPEYATASLGTLETYDQLEKQHGHIYNWTDIETLKAIPPFTVSAVDSGNLAASLYTLHTGSLELLEQPVLRRETFEAVDWMCTWSVGRVSGPAFPDESPSIHTLINTLFNSRHTSASPVDVGADSDGKRWIAVESSNRERQLIAFIETYTPWLLPQFQSLLEPAIAKTFVSSIPTLEAAAAYARSLLVHLESRPEDTLGLSSSPLLPLLRVAALKLDDLREAIATVARSAERHAEAMDFGFLLLPERQLLSIGYDGPTAQLHPACYDLLASEARMASFLAVAKGDIPQQSWFRLGRSHVLVRGRPCLLSWTGTMFEYMMPTLWMRAFPDTLIARSLEAAVRTQREHVKGIPWGISESGFAALDDSGRYGYHAWGIPSLASKYGSEDGPVISPYSTFLALPILRKDAILNLRDMATKGWTGAYGFYEAADYQSGRQPQLVRSWMAHHLGMSLLAISNALSGNIFQRWFHANPRVRASELLLHEKPLSNDTAKALSERESAKVRDQ